MRPLQVAPTWSKVELGHQLHLTLALRAPDLPECRRRYDQRRWRLEDRRIGGVECSQAKLEVLPLGHAELLVQREIQPRHPGTARRIHAAIFGDILNPEMKNP